MPHFFLLKVSGTGLLKESTVSLTAVSFSVLSVLFSSTHSIFVLSLNAVKSAADLFDDDDEGDLFKEKPAIPPVAASTTKEAESEKETAIAKKVMGYK